MAFICINLSTCMTLTRSLNVQQQDCSYFPLDELNHLNQRKQIKTQTISENQILTVQKSENQKGLQVSNKREAELQIRCPLTEPFKSDILCRRTTSHERPSPILSKDLISISSYCLSYNSYDASLENLVLDQLKIPYLILSLFSSLVCLILY